MSVSNSLDTVTAMTDLDGCLNKNGFTAICGPSSVSHGMEVVFRLYDEEERSHQTVGLRYKHNHFVSLRHALAHRDE